MHRYRAKPLVIFLILRNSDIWFQAGWIFCKTILIFQFSLVIMLLGTWIAQISAWNYDIIMILVKCSYTPLPKRCDLYCIYSDKPINKSPNPRPLQYAENYSAHMFTRWKLTSSSESIAGIPSNSCLLYCGLKALPQKPKKYQFVIAFLILISISFCLSSLSLQQK